MMQDSGNALAEVLLERLQDIHGAAEPSWWPPAPGWWVVGAILLAVLAYALVVLIRWLRVHLRRRRLLRQLDAVDRSFDPHARPADYLAALNRLFRAVAIRAFPGSGCARLHGRDWVEFVRERLPGAADARVLGVLEAGPYQPHPDFDPAELRMQARKWVLSHG